MRTIAPVASIPTAIVGNTLTLAAPVAAPPRPVRMLVVGDSTAWSVGDGLAVWAEANPDVPYDQGAMNAQYDPDINTGGYGDGSFFDEFRWAAAELFVTTGDPFYLAAFDPTTQNAGVPGWPHVGSLGLFTLAHHREQVALGTNVDPYQRAEGRYRLMPGILAALRPAYRAARAKTSVRAMSSSSSGDPSTTLNSSVARIRPAT